MIDFRHHPPGRSSSVLFHPMLCWQLPLFVLLLTISICLPRTSGAASNKIFPEYPEIKAAVKFWEDIYSTHSIHSSVIHDHEDLSRIYEVIQLLDRNLPAAEKINRTAIQQAVEKYKNILEGLGKGNPPVTVEEIRIAAMFSGPERLKQMTEAAGRIRSQTGLKERFIEGVTRSGAYIGAIKAILTDYGLPVELAYLPHVESSFNPKAYSKFGAAGVWQFTKATGEQYMQINDTVDERRDPLIAAEAAAKYLKNSYMLLGEWPEAITAYNYGTAGMLRAQNSHGSYPAIYTSYSEGHFGFASRNFYSEFLAALKVATHLEQDSSIPKDQALIFATYPLPGFIHLYDVKKHFALNEKELKILNPALRDPVFQGKRLIPRRYQLRLPAGARTEKLITTIPLRMLSNSQMTESLYRVKRGDTAGAIASNNDIPLKVLLRANALDSDARIYVGQKLRIPSHPRLSSAEPLLPHLASERESFKRFSSPDEKKTAQVPVIRARKKLYPEQTPVAREALKRDTISVHPDETLPLFAHWLKMDEAELRKANKLAITDTIQPGQKLIVLYDEISAAEFADLRADFARENQEDFFAAFQVADQITYEVQPGDTIWNLCNRKFHIPLWLLKKYNDSIDYSTIQQSQTLVIPIVVER
ncbi:LysM peptidoglycan-binding domain-containing protein [Desulfosediminicola sp.]|uniref:LysM peptidoglycan-binding domain-containing protein n=1 Tax=Desulfosediminicola sp. TaxID=2886825 RepID=UPI003AF2006E